MIWARRSLAAASVYILVMIVSAAASRRIVLDSWVQAEGARPKALMVGPLPITPFSKAIIVDAGDRFETGTFSWIPPHVRLDRDPLPNRAEDPAVQLARGDPTLRMLLDWSRFPYFDLTSRPDGTLVTFTDLRFGSRIGRTTVLVPR